MVQPGLRGLPLPPHKLPGLSQKSHEREAGGKMHKKEKSVTLQEPLTLNRTLLHSAELLNLGQLRKGERGCPDMVEACLPPSQEGGGCGGSYSLSGKASEVSLPADMTKQNH